jgi:hypothetical protein
MTASFPSPGVFREDTFLQPEAALRTGVPGFVGFAEAAGARPGRAVALQRKEEFFERFTAPPEGFLGEAVRGFFDNGGARCYVSCADPSARQREAALVAALGALAPLEDLDLVAAPDASALALEGGRPDAEAAARVGRALIRHCAEHGGRMAILDPPPGRTPETVLAYRHALMAGQGGRVGAALYYPWLKTRGGRLVPPSGHVAGVYARSDARVGVHKAPANEELLGVSDLAALLDDAAQAQLNPAGVNCLRAFAGRGIRVWGARTLSGEGDWRYVNVMRLFLTLGRWVELNMTWATLEPNVPRLWVRVQRELGSYLDRLWRAGALRGGVPAEAYYVKCDSETNPPESRELGRVVTEVGLAATAPAEFVVVRIFHRPGTTEVS